MDYQYRFGNCIYSKIKRIDDVYRKDNKKKNYSGINFDLVWMIQITLLMAINMGLFILILLLLILLIATMAPCKKRFGL